MTSAESTKLSLVPTTDNSLRSKVVEQARRLGALSVRFTTAEPDARAGEQMRASFTRGDLSSWPYDQRYARAATTPRMLLPDARSVVCIAMPYATLGSRSRPLSGQVSNYAWSPDYHRRMKAVLSEIAAVIEKRAGDGTTRIVCDTAPLAERAFAARAGLGWVGKHTNLIDPKFGSFVFLGEIVTTVAFDADAPLQKNCGACRRCVDVCPTGALRGDYTIDARRCISDLTQRTDGIPRELRPLIGVWVWGCDLCQQICPPTLKAGIAPRSDNSAISQDVAAPSLVWLLRLRSGEFRRMFAPTAIGWRGGAVLRRNAAVALGNALDRSSVPALREALVSDPHAMVRGHVAWALGRVGSPAAVAALREQLKRESKETVREEIVSALEPFAEQRALSK